ncbi:TRAP transporter substrate-binding protein [Falsiroseomonas selenitidurans]|uniref:TRAP transporter substrate-binding protein n=1 Tax=Falsiroseomonas selenitidurans TaxID=2716335 RepID=A0ABX1E2T4_9PROT|nr:TRAP transporter substrate-binding protein [Falsiroseomonas selenitidurans]NKC30128.1 TRAP transporter substrate-binding protein [Falsiroseomonas selenitidurans]
MTLVTTRRGLAALGFAAPFIARPALAQTLVLKAAHTNAVGEVQDEGLKVMDRRLRELTGGRAGLQIFPNGQLGNELPMIEGVALGTIDIAVPSHAAFANFVKDFQLFDMPYLVRDYAHLDKIAGSPLIGELVEASRGRNFRLLSLYSSGIRHVMARGAVTSIGDLRGRKVRTQQNPVHVAAFQAFGANATPLAYGELYGALQVGVVDGAEAAYTNYVGQKFYEVAKNWARIGWLALTAPVILSERRWASLPADIKAAVQQAANESASFERNLVVQGEAALHTQVMAHGATVTDPDKAPFQAAAQPLYARFLTSEADKRRLKLVQELV